MATTTRNPSIKRMEKEFLKESKAEEGAVKQNLKDLSRLEKEVKKAQKSAGNADLTLNKRGQYEHKTAKYMNEAIHDHDLATVKLRAAEKDLELKQKHRAKLARELEAKKDAVDKAIQMQSEHDQARETKLAQMRGAVASLQEPLPPKKHVGFPGQSGPAVDNDGHAPGYGVDYNHTAINSEGDPHGNYRA